MIGWTLNLLSFDVVEVPGEQEVAFRTTTAGLEDSFWTFLPLCSLEINILLSIRCCDRKAHPVEQAL